MVVTAEDRSEIVFFDVETTVPARQGQGFAILEFGAILVCPRRLVELRNYSTLVRPADLSHVSTLSVRCNGITKEAVVSAPTFADIADVVYDLLHGRIWAGHNILKFDIARIREAFAEINRPPPEPKGTIDSLVILRQKFGRRAGDMKMASLATYFGLGQQTHRSLDDVRMNLEVVKYCATVLFLESSLPDVFTENSWISPNATTRSRRNGKSSPETTGRNENDTPLSSVDAVSISASSSTSPSTAGSRHLILSSLLTSTADEALSSLIESSPVRVDPFDMSTLCDEVENENLNYNRMEEDRTTNLVSEVGESSTTSVSYEHSLSSSNGYLEVDDDVPVSSISVALARTHTVYDKIRVLYQDSALKLHCSNLKIRFGISTKYADSAGRPKLNIVVDAPPSLCLVLEKADRLAKDLSINSGSSSDWRDVVNRKPGFYNSPTVRLHLQTITEGETTQVGTEIYEEDNSGRTRKVVLNQVDVVELDSLFSPGNLVDAFFSVNTYDYQQNAGIRLAAEKLLVHSSS